MYKRIPTLIHHEFMNKHMLVLQSLELGSITGVFRSGANMELIAKELRHMADRIDSKTEEYKNGT